MHWIDKQNQKRIKKEKYSIFVVWTLHVTLRTWNTYLAYQWAVSSLANILSPHGAYNFSKAIKCLSVIFSLRLLEGWGPYVGSFAKFSLLHSTVQDCMFTHLLFLLRKNYLIGKPWKNINSSKLWNSNSCPKIKLKSYITHYFIF